MRDKKSLATVVISAVGVVLCLFNGIFLTFVRDDWRSGFGWFVAAMWALVALTPAIHVRFLRLYLADKKDPIMDP